MMLRTTYEATTKINVRTDDGITIIIPNTLSYKNILFIETQMIDLLLSITVTC
jgi:hypothetical protein